MSDFGKRLKQALEDKGISAAELSRQTGIGKNLISYYIHGVCLAKQDKIYLMARILDVDPGWLMTGVEQKTEVIPEEEIIPETPEARVLAKGMDRMPEAQRKAIMTMMEGLYPGFFKEGMKNDDT